MVAYHKRYPMTANRQTNSHSQSIPNKMEVKETGFLSDTFPLTTKLRSNHATSKMDIGNWIRKPNFFFSNAKGEGRTNGQINSIRGTATCLPGTRKLRGALFYIFPNVIYPCVVKALYCRTMVAGYFAYFVFLFAQIFVLCPCALRFMAPNIFVKCSGFFVGNFWSSKIYCRSSVAILTICYIMWVSVFYVYILWKLIKNIHWKVFSNCFVIKPEIVYFLTLIKI